MEILKISSKSNVKKVAGALANIIRRDNEVEAQTIGAGSLNTLVKSVIVARGYLAPSDIDLYMVPSFTDIKINDDEKTAIKIIVKAREK